MKGKNTVRRLVIRTMIIIAVAILGYIVFLSAHKNNSAAVHIPRSPEPKPALPQKVSTTTEKPLESQNKPVPEENALSTTDLSHIEKDIMKEFNEVLPKDPVVFQWQLLPLISFSNFVEIEAVVADIPFDRSLAVTEDEEKSLRTSAAETLHSIFANSPQAYLKAAKRRGEKIIESKAIWARGILESNDLLETDSSELSHEDIFKLYWNSFCTQSSWVAASPDKANFTPFTLTCEPGEVKSVLTKRSREEMSKLGNRSQGIHGFRRFVAPEKDVEQIAAESGEPVCANLLIFIRNQGKHNLTLPYVLQFWFNSSTNFWHPHVMECGSYKKASLILF